MYIYNVTVNIDANAEAEFVLWMQQTHLPAMLQTRKFTEAKMTLVHVEENIEGRTYSTQYSCNSKEDLEAYFKEDADQLREEMDKKFAGRYVAFRTELEIILHYKVKS
ncbi:MAG: DUF4286 family protein [Flavobacteriaceae bacterium]|nr:DUF4286 family protein [Flavobacteriaceae bacterium]